MGPQKCQVCEGAQSKYKCPTCLLPYCSLPCYKKHKEIPCTKPVQPVVESMASEELRSMLKDGELQRIILNIDSSSTPEQDLDKAMEGPMFRDFSDKDNYLLNTFLDKGSPSFKGKKASCSCNPQSREVTDPLRMIMRFNNRILNLC